MTAITSMSDVTAAMDRRADERLTDASAALVRAATSDAPPHPVRAACLTAAVKLVSLIPTRIVGFPDMADARGVIDDLDAVCAIVDPLIKAIGEYAEQHFGSLDQSLFTDQVLGALDGNATFEIEQAARRLLADRHDGAIERAAEFRRGV